MQKIGYVGQRKSDGKWFARVQVNGQDKTKVSFRQKSVGLKNQQSSVRIVTGIT
jgi:hypothetical protein